jgi:hypothetical protein
MAAASANRHGRTHALNLSLQRKAVLSLSTGFRRTAKPPQILLVFARRLAPFSASNRTNLQESSACNRPFSPREPTRAHPSVQNSTPRTRFVRLHPFNLQ